MPVRWKLSPIDAGRNVSSISHEGFEHKVIDGHLHVEMMTPTLEKELTARGMTKVDEDALARERRANFKPLTDDERKEKAHLLDFLDEQIGTRVDRRNSLARLREMASDYDSYVPYVPAEQPPPAPGGDQGVQQQAP